MSYQHTRAFNPRDLFKGINAQATTRDYLDRQDIYAQGDEADAMFYVQRGNVKLTVTSKTGRKAVVAILRHGDFFGEGCLARRSPRMSSATAIQGSTIARVKRAALVRAIHREPAFAKLFISYLLFRIGQSQEARSSAPAKND